MSGAEYQFQVAVMAVFQGQQLVGGRSDSELCFHSALTSNIQRYFSIQI